MAFYPSNQNYHPFTGQDRNADWMPASPHMSSPRPLTRGDSLESIGQFGFVGPFNEHQIYRDNSFGSRGSKRVKWNKGVKNGRHTVGCAAFQQGCSAAAFPQGCSAFPNAFDDTADGVARTGETKGFLQRIADVAISNVQKCGVGMGRQCEGRGANVSVLSSLIGDAMCMRCGADEDDGFSQGRCMQCQNYIHSDRDPGTIGLRGQHRHIQTNTYGVSGTAHRHSNYHISDPIAQARENIAASHNPMMEPRLQMMQAGYVEREERSNFTNDALFNADANENDRYAMNHRNLNYMNQMRSTRRGISDKRGSMKEKTKMVGKCVMKSLSNPVQRLKHGMKRKTILTITRGR